MDEFGALAGSERELARRLSALPPDLGAPSACPGWSLYDLVNHVVGGAVRYRMLLDDAPAAEMQATRTQDHIANDAVGALAAADRALRVAFERPGALAQVVHHPAGDRTGAELLRMRVLELSMHAVDVSRSLSLDESLDDELVQFMLGECLPLIAQLRAAGLYAPERAVAADEPPLSRLLAFAGR